MTPHLISRVTILGTGLIAGPFPLALRKHPQRIRVSRSHRPQLPQQPPLHPECARTGPLHSLAPDACSRKLRLPQAAAELFPGDSGPLFLAGHPMAGRELSGLAHADAGLFRNSPYALVRESSDSAVVAGLPSPPSFPPPPTTPPPPPPPPPPPSTPSTT